MTLDEKHNNYDFLKNSILDNFYEIIGLVAGDELFESSEKANILAFQNSLDSFNSHFLADNGFIESISKEETESSNIDTIKNELERLIQEKEDILKEIDGIDKDLSLTTEDKQTKYVALLDQLKVLTKVNIPLVEDKYKKAKHENDNTNRGINSANNDYLSNFINAALNLNLKGITKEEIEKVGQRIHDLFLRINHPDDLVVQNEDTDVYNEVNTSQNVKERLVYTGIVNDAALDLDVLSKGTEYEVVDLRPISREVKLNGIDGWFNRAAFTTPEKWKIMNESKTNYEEQKINVVYIGDDAYNLINGKEYEVVSHASGFYTVLETNETYPSNLFVSPEKWAEMNNNINSNDLLWIETNFEPDNVEIKEDINSNDLVETNSELDEMAVAQEIVDSKTGKVTNTKDLTQVDGFDKITPYIMQTLAVGNITKLPILSGDTAFSLAVSTAIVGMPDGYSPLDKLESIAENNKFGIYLSQVKNKFYNENKTVGSKVL